MNVPPSMTAPFDPTIRPPRTASRKPFRFSGTPCFEGQPINSRRETITTVATATRTPRRIFENPVCGMTVNRIPRTASSIRRRLSFLCGGCHEVPAEPGRYLARPPVPARDAGARSAGPPPARPGKYTCPMHPEIVRDGPGRLPDLRNGPRAHGSHARRGGKPRVRAHAAPVLGESAADGPAFRSRDGRDDHRARASLRGSRRARFVWLQLVLATPVVLWGGAPFFARGWASIVHRSLNMFTLIVDRRRDGVFVQRRRRSISVDISRVVPLALRRGRRVLRSGGRDRDPRASRPDPRAQGAEPHERGLEESTGARPQDSKARDAARAPKRTFLSRTFIRATRFA